MVRFDQSTPPLFYNIRESVKKLKKANKTFSQITEKEKSWIDWRDHCPEDYALIKCQPWPTNHLLTSQFDVIRTIVRKTSHKQPLFTPSTSWEMSHSSKKFCQKILLEWLGLSDYRNRSWINCSGHVRSCGLWQAYYFNFLLLAWMSICDVILIWEKCGLMTHNP